MQMIPVNPKTANKAMHHMPATDRQPFPPSVMTPAPVVAIQSPTHAHERTRASTLSELDSMLIEDPNVGAIHGLRIALLFNAGLALTGLMVWELWSMLAF